jgi:hypothetical protein
MDNLKQGLVYSRRSSTLHHYSSALLGYVALGFLALALAMVVSQGPAIPDPGFATVVVLP